MDSDFSDAESVTSSTLGSETASISSSVLNYEYENGRRYHAYKAGHYLIPNDEQEQDRIDIMHHVHCMILGGELLTAPIKEPQTILDVGTGTGIWAIEMADRYPDAQVIATDLSAIQPTWIPPNLTFEIDDIESDWNFSCKFDYIHLRNMAGAMSDWPLLLRKCFEGLNPGGYVEIIDGEAWAQSDDGSLSDDSNYVVWQTNLNKAARMFGRDLNIIPRMTEIVKEAGFEEVTDHIVKVPLNHWDQGQSKQERERATYMNFVMNESIEAYSLGLFTKVLGWSKERLDEHLVQVRTDLRNSKHHMYSPFHHVCGRKPAN